MTVITISIIIISGICEAVKDTLSHHHSTSVFKKVSPTSFWGKESWRRKYKNLDPLQGRAFPGSTTALVWITDGWHLVKLLHLIGLFSLMAFPIDLQKVLVLYFTYSMTFHIFYHKILIKK